MSTVRWPRRHRPILTPIFFAGVAAAAMGACQSPPGAKGPAPDRPDAAINAFVELDAAVPSQDAPTSQSAIAPDASALPPVPSTTPGKILCGALECDLRTQVCCESRDRAECVPKSSDPNKYACGDNEDAVERHCDETPDCPKGQGCCASWGCSGGCPQVDECEAVPCRHGPLETCLPGGTCSPGFRCMVQEGNRTGTCAYTNAGVACGASHRCSGATPACCWNTKTRTGTCAANCPGGDNEDLMELHCLSSDDCGGYPCANLTVGSNGVVFCNSGYYVPDQSSLVFCRKLSDCPKMNMAGKPKACRPDRHYPGNAKVCIYPNL